MEKFETKSVAMEALLTVAIQMPEEDVDRDHGACVRSRAR
jgi:hypothetical protein